MKKYIAGISDGQKIIAVDIAIWIRMLKRGSFIRWYGIITLDSTIDLEYDQTYVIKTSEGITGIIKPTISCTGIGGSFNIEFTGFEIEY